MNTTAATRKRADRGIGALGVLWLVVIASTPIQQFIYVYVTSQVRLLTLTAAVLSLLFARYQAPRLQPAFLAAAALIALAGGVSGTNSDLGASFLVAVSFALMVALVPGAIMAQAQRDPRFLRWAVTATLAVQTASAVAGILQIAGLTVFGADARAGRVNGLAYHPNVLGLMSALAILVLFEAWRRRAASRWLIGVALVLNGIALTATASLSSLLALTVGSFFFVVRLSLGWRLLVLVGGIFLLVFALIATAGNPLALIPGFADRVEQVTGAAEDDGVASFLVRLQTYDFALRYLSRDPFIGVGMDPSNQGTVTPELVVHSYLLRGWFQGGLLLFLALLILTIALVWLAFHAFRKTKYIAPSAVILAVLAFAATSAFYNQPHYWMPILLAVVFISSVLPRDKKAESFLSRSSSMPGQNG